MEYMLNEKRQSNGIRHDLRYLVPYLYNLKKCEKTHGGVSFSKVASLLPIRAKRLIKKKLENKKIYSIA